MKSIIQLFFVLLSLSIYGQGVIVENADITLGTNSTLKLENGAGLYLSSNAMGTSSLIDNQNISISGGGTIEIERYIPKYVGSDGWHFLSSPVADQTIRPEFVSNTSPIPGNDDFYKWEESTNYWINTKDNGGNWNTGFESDFVVGKAYLVAYDENVTKIFSGIPNSGDFSFNQSTTPTISFTSGQGEGWNLLGNPYPSAIDWDNLNRTNIDASVYVFDGDIGQYVSWNGSVGALNEGIIPPMNGFFVKVSTGACITVPNNSRLHTSTSFYKNSIDDLIVLKVQGNGFSDHTYLHFNENATNEFDSQFDAYKLLGIEEAPQLYTLAGEDKLSINELPFSAEKTIKLSLKTGEKGRYKISIDNQITGLLENLFLEDLKEGLFVNILQEGSYEFYSEKEDSHERFLLHFTSKDVEVAESEITVYPNPSNNCINVKYYGKKPIYIDLIGLTGNLLGHYIISENKTINISNLPRNVYLIKTSNGQVIKCIKL